MYVVALADTTPPIARVHKGSAVPDAIHHLHRALTIAKQTQSATATRELKRLGAALSAA
jgi:hypothetical protein